MKIVGTLETTEKSNEVVLSAVGELLQAAGGDSTVALKALLAQTQTKAVAKQAEKSTAATRKVEFKRMLDETSTDIEALAEIETMAAGLIGRIISNSLETEAGLMTPKQSHALMAEHLDRKKLIEVLDARHEMVKAAIFRHITEAKAMEGELDPENVNGSLDVPEIGKRFSREGTGYGNPQVDEGRLRALVGEDRWAASCEMVEIPAKVGVKFSIKKFLDQARANVEMLEALEECLVPGPVKSPSLNVRNLSDKET